VPLRRSAPRTPVLMRRRTHVAAAETPRPIAAARTSRGLFPRMPRPRNISQRASNASGSAASCDSTNAVSISLGSGRYPSLHSRHIEVIAGGSSSPEARTPRSGEDVIGRFLLTLAGRESLRLQIEHRPVAAAEVHQLVMGSQLDHPPVLEH